MKGHLTSRTKKWGLLYLISVVLLLPFAVLTFFVVPSADDYMFANFTNTVGVFESVKSFYLTWTGRYSSMFLLSLHPLSVDSILLYRLISLAFLLISGHAVYFFLRQVFQLNNRIQAAIISMVFLFVYLSNMPNLVQGFYWLPGSVTYQLSNVLIVYFLAGVYPKLKAESVSIGWVKGLLHLALILVICGLSEVSFIVLNVLIGSMLMFGYLENKKVHGWLVVHMFFAIICSVVVLLAPGVSLRETIDGVNLEKRSVLENIWNSIVTTIELSGSWILSINLLLFSLAFLIVLSVNGTIFQGDRHQRSFKTIAIGFLWGLFLLFVSIYPLHHVFGDITPLRAVNVTYWIFLFLWMFFLFTIHQWLSAKFNRQITGRAETYVLICLLLLVVGSGYSSRYYIAWNDLLSGRATEFDRQFKDRDELMRNCETGICEFPNFSVFPKTIFNEDFGREFESNFAWVFANYYGRSVARATFEEPEFLTRISINLEEEKTELLSNWQTRSDRVARSGFFSSCVDTNSVYSVTMRVPFSYFQVDNIHLLSHAEASVYTQCRTGHCSAILVLCVVDSNGEVVYWNGEPIQHNLGESEEWIETSLFAKLPDLQIRKDHEILVYVWNNTGSTLCVDDLELIVY